MIPYKTDTDISSYIIFPRFLIPPGIIQRRQGAVRPAFGSGGDIQEERLHRSGWNHPPVLHCGGRQNKTPPKQAGGNTGVSRTGILRPDLPSETGPWQTSCDYPESAG